MVALAFLALLLAGCAIIPAPTRSARVGGSDPLAACADFLLHWINVAAEAQVIDPGAFRVEGHPYMRLNRFLASFREEVGDKTAFAAWVDRMQALDQDARKYEIANLPKAAGSVPGSANDNDGINARVNSCGTLLKAADFQDGEQQAVLRKG